MTRLTAVTDRALPYLGPTLALLVGLVGLGRRSLDVDEAAIVAAARSAFPPSQRSTSATACVMTTRGMPYSLPLG